MDYVEIQHIPCFIHSGACSNREVDIKTQTTTYQSDIDVQPDNYQDPQVSE